MTLSEGRASRDLAPQAERARTESSTGKPAREERAAYGQDCPCYCPGVTPPSVQPSVRSSLNQVPFMPGSF